MATETRSNVWVGFEGDVLEEASPGFEDARGLWNGMIETRPVLIARPASAADVAAALQIARERGLTVTVRGGGHGVAGSALSEGGLVLDLRSLKAIEVDPEARLARAKGGVTLGELDAATQAHGLATPLGVVTKTGIAGLTLSGGIGWLRRKHGLSLDNLVSLEVVTADGRVLNASEAENADLFWALRGGGGSFGVVTSFEYRLHPVGPEVMVAFVLYPAERSAEILRVVDEFAQAAPEDAAPLAFFGRVPHADAFPAEAHGGPYVAAVVVYTGDPEEGERVTAPLRELGDPIVDLSGVMPFVEAQALLDEDYPDGWRYYWKSVELDQLSDEALARLDRHAAAAPSHHSTIDIWFHGGAMSRVAPEATAFGPRPPYLIGIEANWEEAADDEVNVAWARAAFDHLRELSSGGAYLNFPGLLEEGDKLLRASFGEPNFERLRELKRKYDPDGLFGPLGGVRPGP